MNFKHILILTVLICIVACGSKQQTADAPTAEIASEAYKQYLQSATTGHTYAEALSFHSKKRQEEMIDRIEKQSKKSGKPKEKYQDSFLRMTGRAAKCMSLEKLSDNIEGENTLLTYSGTDTCTEDSKAKIKVSVNLINENGWKIRSEKVNISFE